MVVSILRDNDAAQQCRIDFRRCMSSSRKSSKDRTARYGLVQNQDAPACVPHSGAPGSGEAMPQVNKKSIASEPHYSA